MDRNGSSCKCRRLSIRPVKKTGSRLSRMRLSKGRRLPVSAATSTQIGIESTAVPTQYHRSLSYQDPES
jgi:hypothetical protein